MTGIQVSGEELAALFNEARTVFRLEDQKSPMTFEQDAYQQFLEGSPLEPREWPAWQDWLDRVRVMTSRGKQVSRIAIIDEPPVPYQQWRMWAAPWHHDAGERLQFLPYHKAKELHIPVGNWWLFDDEQAVYMTFTETGGVGEMTLVTGPVVGAYRRWRDLAVSHAETAESVTA